MLHHLCTLWCPTCFQIFQICHLMGVKWGGGPNNLNAKIQFDITLLLESAWNYCTDKQMPCCVPNYRIVQTRISVGELTKQHMCWSFSGGKTSIDFLGFPQKFFSLYFRKLKPRGLIGHCCVHNVFVAAFFVLGRIRKTPLASQYLGLIGEINERVWNFNLKWNQDLNLG